MMLTKQTKKIILYSLLLAPIGIIFIASVVAIGLRERFLPSSLTHNISHGIAISYVIIMSVSIVWAYVAGLLHEDSYKKPARERLKFFLISFMFFVAFAFLVNWSSNFTIGFILHSWNNSEDRTMMTVERTKARRYGALCYRAVIFEGNTLLRPKYLCTVKAEIWNKINAGSTLVLEGTVSRYGVAVEKLIW